MADTKAEVAELERRRCAALAARDMAALAALFTDDYVHCHASGRIDDRAAMVAHTEANPRTIEPRDPVIRVWGDAAIITGETVNRSVGKDGQVALARMFTTQVARRIDGAWKFVSFQATRLPDR